MESIMIILLHGGSDHGPSDKILKYIRKTKIDGISKICIVDEKMKQIIKNNPHIKINEVPSLIIYRTKTDFEIYPATKDNVKYILEQLKNA